MLAEEQARQGHDVTVFTTNAGLASGEVPDSGGCILRHGVKVHYFVRQEGLGIKSHELESAVGKRIKEFDLMHLSAIWHPVARAAHAAAKKCRVPVIISPRGALGSYAWSRRRWLKVAYYALFERRHFQAAAAFHFTSQKEESESKRYCFQRPSSIIPNGIDHRFWARNETAGSFWRTTQGISADERVILNVGRLHHKKGLEILPETLAILRDKCPGEKIRLVLVGPDEDGTLGRLRVLAARFGVQGGLTWVPTMQDMELPAVYSAANVFVLPSLHENFGNSAIEALACGCRSLVSTETGCLEFGAGCGMEAVSEHSPSAWAGAIAEGLTHEPVTFKGSVQRELWARVSLQATAAEMLRFYESILDGWA